MEGEVLALLVDVEVGKSGVKEFVMIIGLKVKGYILGSK